MRKFVLSLFAVLVLALQGFAQNRQVTGTVTLEDGSPLAGVTVIVQGANQGTITRADGSYSVQVPANGALQFSFIGFQDVLMPLDGKTIINVVMKASTLQIDDVVVTAVGIRRAERSLGYSVSKVDADEGIQKAEPDLMRALDGKIPGVVVGSPSGSAGSATRVTIRGNSSFLGNNQPLYVVDGVPYSNEELETTRQGAYGGSAYGSGLSTLDPNNIESMSVLKGAAAAAIYGSRAANGVVLITTKTGSKGLGSQRGLEITFNGSYAIEQIAALPDYQNTYGQGSNFRYQSANGSWGPNFNELKTIPFNSSTYSDIYAAYPNWANENYPELNGEIPYQAYPNNVKNLFRTGGMYEGSLSVSSTNDKGNFGMTVSRLTQDGYVPSNEYERFSISVGGNQRLANGLRVGGNVSFSRDITDGFMGGNNQSSSEAGGMNALARAFIMPRSWDIQKYPYTNPDGSNLLFNISSQANNPYWAWENDFVTTSQDRTVANFNVGYDITEWLSVDYSFGFNNYNMERKEVVNLGSRGYAGVGRIKEDRRTIDELESTLLIQASHQITESIGFKATLGHNVNQYTVKRNFLEGKNMINKGVYSIQNTESQVAEDLYSRKRLWGVFADIGFDYKQWLFLNFTGRNDWSSTLPSNDRSYFYPAVSSSFVFTDAFNLRNDVIDFGKIRVGWAKVGSDASPYYYNGKYVLVNPYMGQPGLELGATLYDEGLKPEFSEEVEIGLDMAFFKGRLGFDISLYSKNSTNQIARATVASSSGYRYYWTNFGKMNNKGFEIGLNAVPVMTRDFRWNIFGTFTRNVGEVKELKEGVSSISVGGDFGSPSPVLEVGQPYGVLRGTMIARDDEGNPLVDPTSGMYFNAPESGYIGDPNPMYKTSLTNTLSYKGITFSFMVDFQKGGCVYSTYVTDLLGRGVTRDTENRLGTRIIPGVLGTTDADGNYVAMRDANGNKIKNYVQISESDVYFSGGSLSTFGINSADEIGVYDATTLRLREISIGWDLPKRWISSLGIGGVNVSAVGRNLWFYAPNVPKYTNFDPTVSSYGGSNVQGIDYTGALSSKRYGFNIRVTF